MEAIGGRSILSWRGFLCYFVLDFIIIIIAICAMFGGSPNRNRVLVEHRILSIEFFYFKYSFNVHSSTTLFLFQLLRAHPF